MWLITVYMAQYFVFGTPVGVGFGAYIWLKVANFFQMPVATAGTVYKPICIHFFIPI